MRRVLFRYCPCHITRIRVTGSFVTAPQTSAYLGGAFILRLFAKFFSAPAVFFYVLFCHGRHSALHRSEARKKWKANSVASLGVLRSQPFLTFQAYQGCTEVITRPIARSPISYWSYTIRHSHEIGTSGPQFRTSSTHET
jgi:hypothetical protein